MTTRTNYSSWQQASLSLLRMAIGWHCLHEGLIKLAKQGGWSGIGYLKHAHGPLAPIFRKMTEFDLLVQFNDLAVMWILTIFGGFLLVGLFTRFSSIMLMGLIALFYLANPPIDGDAAFWLKQAGAEGTYWIVNKNIIEIFALWVILAFEDGSLPGLDAMVGPWLREKFGKSASQPTEG